ncbi:MAG TPA: hypothetical protein VGN34_21560 [Ktedonobacteraceae bacterium]
MRQSTLQPLKFGQSALDRRRIVIDKVTNTGQRYHRCNGGKNCVLHRNEGQTLLRLTSTKEMAMG